MNACLTKEFRKEPCKQWRKVSLWEWTWVLLRESSQFTNLN